jgi:uncharacterized phiE125 gp8 family phage protein
MITRIYTKPSVEPVSLTDAKKHLRLAVSDADATAYTAEDAKLAMIITTARENVESHTNRALVTQTWDAVIDCFPAGNVLVLPNAPLQSITSISYTDTEGHAATFTGYTADLFSNAARLNAGSSWPSIYEDSRITVRFVAGYGNAATDVPASIRQAMFLLIGHLYENPIATVNGQVDVVPMGVDLLLADFRRYDL